MAILKVNQTVLRKFLPLSFFLFSCFLFCPAETRSQTVSPTDTPTITPTDSQTITPLNTPSNTSTASSTNTPTNTPLNTFTPTFTGTPTKTVTSTNTSTASSTNTVTNTPLDTLTPTITGTPTITPTITDSPTITDTPTITLTPTITSTPTPTFTLTLTFTATVTDTQTLSETPTVTNTITLTPPPFPAGSYIGNQSVFSATNSVTLNANNIRGSSRFTARSSMTVGAIDLYFESAAGSPQYQVGMQGDSSGVPDGTYLAAPVPFTPVGNGWQSIPLSPTVGIAAGAAYHIVVEPISANGSVYAVWRQSSVPPAQLYPQGQSADPNMGIAQDLGAGTWSAVPGYQPIFVLRDGSLKVADGNPYAVQVDEPVTLQAEQFVVNGGPVTVKTIGAYVKAVGSPGANLMWAILTTPADWAFASGILATPGQVGTGYGWVDTGVSPLVLPNGVYLFELTSGPGNYLWSLAGSSTNGTPVYPGLTYGKDAGYGAYEYFSIIGGTWTGYSAPTDSDFGFRMQLDDSATSTPTQTPTATPVGAMAIGNQAVVSGSNGIVLDDMVLRGSVRFTARSNMAVGGIDLYFENVLNNPRYRVGIEGDSGGLPSGTFLSAPATLLPYGQPWQSISLSSAVSLTAGTAYHIVVEPVSVNGTNYAVWRQASGPPTHLYPSGQTLDTNMGIAQDLGNGWTGLPGYQPIFVLRDGSLNVIDGNPFAVETDENIGGLQVYGENFWVNGTPATIKTVGAYVRQSGTPSGNLTWAIQDQSAGVTVASGTLATPGQLGTNYQWLDQSIPDSVLPVGIYRLILNTPGLTGGYQWSLAGPGSGVTVYENISYASGGVNNGTGWMAIDNSVSDFGFRMQLDTSATPTPTPTATPLGAVFLGNQAVVTANSAGLFLEDTKVRGSLRFTAQTSMALGGIDLYLGYSIYNQGFRVGIQGDSGGTPNGTYLAAPVTFLANGGGWNSIPLSPTVNLTAGTIYHIVVDASNFGGGTIWKQGTQPPTDLYPLGQVLDPNLGIVQDVGTGWKVVPGYEPIFALRDGTLKIVGGNPYAVETDEDVAGTNPPGEILIVNGVPVTVKTIGAFVKQVGNPSGNLNWSILTQNSYPGVTVVSGTLATPGQLGPDYRWIDVGIPSTAVTTGIYAFVLSSSSSSPGNDYQWSAANTGSMSATYAGLTYGKDNLFAGLYYTDSLGQYGNNDYDFGFRMQVDTSTPAPTPTPTPVPAGESVIGNQSVFSASNDLVLNDMSTRGSIRFAARSNMSVNSISVYFDNVFGSPQYQMSLEGDSAGVPNGTHLAGPTTFAPTSAGWWGANLGSSLVSGTVYHIVVEPVNLTTGHAIFRQASLPFTGLYPLGQQVDPAMGIAQDLGSGWKAVSGYQPIFALYSNSVFAYVDGNPYAVQMDKDSAGVTEQAERFTVSNPYIINSVGAYIRKVGTPSGNLSWEIRDLSGNLAASGTLATPSQVGTAYQWVDASITPAIIPVGTNRFILTSSGSSLGNDYQWSLSGSSTIGFANLGVITYDGTNSFGDFSTDGGSTWGSYTSNPYANDFGFRFYTNGSTPTVTPTGSATPTFTVSPTNTPTITPTGTLTRTSTNTPAYTSTSTTTDIPTFMPTGSPAYTITFTDLPTNTCTNTHTSTATITPTDTSTVTTTLTATASPTNSQTNSFTPTDTPGVSPTPTLTPTPTGAPFTAVFYPNPATGPVVTLRVSLPGQADVKYKIFTVSYHKVKEGTFRDVPAGTTGLSMELVDKWGTPLANGLYFIQVQAGSGKVTCKLIIER